jgi:hypothetical protein
MGWMVGVQFPAETRYFSPALGPIQPIQWVLWALSPGVKRLGCDPDHLPPSSAGVKNGSVIPIVPIHLHGMLLN